MILFFYSFNKKADTFFKRHCPVHRPAAKKAQKKEKYQTNANHKNNRTAAGFGKGSRLLFCMRHSVVSRKPASEAVV